MKEQFTPGDWKAGDWSSYGDWGVESDKSSICCVFGANNENEANAHLIAAAPKMYKALAEISTMLLFKDKTQEQKDLKEHIDLLLAEARGEK